MSKGSENEGLALLFNFEVEGVRRRHIYKNGEYCDATLIAVFKDTIRYPEF
jgi:RimJ/RimL family protein N-acetyltransferase